MRRPLLGVAGAVALVAALLFGPSSVAVAQLLVPDDYPVLQDAIDAASPGDVILIDGGTHGPVVIDKALTLVGTLGVKPMLTTLTAPIVAFTDQVPPVTLSGPGVGRVTLTHLVITGVTSELAAFTDNVPAIVGDGFDELFVLHCDVEAPRWEDSLDSAQAYPGIDVDIPYTLVGDSTVIGGAPHSDVAFFIPFPFPTAGAAVRSTGDVAVFDSTLRGGRGFSGTWDVDAFGAPPTCAELDAGYGGVAVQTTGDLFVARSQLEAGEGAKFFAEQDDFGPWLVCQQGHGPVLAVSGVVHDLNTSLLMANGPLSPGHDFKLVWDADAPNSVLVHSLQPQVPLVLGAKGLLFANPASLQFINAPGSGVQFLSVAVPAVPGLEGVTAVIQRYSVSEGLSAPVFAGYVRN